jgi:hypothetical protein
VILTADYDCLEIFYKAQWFLDAHYRAWLAAPLIKDGLLGNPQRHWRDDERRFFDGSVALYRRHTPHLRELLPLSHSSVRTGVLYVSPDNIVYELAFNFDREMAGMLWTKGENRGRCTDLFGDANIHVNLGPLNVLFDDMFIGVGKDIESTFYVDGTPMAISHLDATHCINCQERTLLSR